MSLPTVILPKLRRLIPLLSSDVAGEVVATAAAITRTLAAARRDWHDLAAQLAEPSADAPPRCRRAPAPAVDMMLDDLLDHPELTDWEIAFVSSVYGQFSRRRRLSEKQIDVLASIWRKIEGADDRAS